MLDVREPGTTHGKPKIEKEEGPSASAVPAIPAVATGPYKFDAARGATLFASTCAACHQANGTGLSGAFPPLVKDPVVLDPDPTRHIRAILHGVSGQTINGAAYASPMPPFGGALSDADVADIANHERTSWGNAAKLVTAEQVKAQR